MLNHDKRQSLAQSRELSMLLRAQVITHKLPLKDAAHGFKIFNNKEDGCVKVSTSQCGQGSPHAEMCW